IAKSLPIRCNAGRRSFAGASDTTPDAGIHGADRYLRMTLKHDLVHYPRQHNCHQPVYFSGVTPISTNPPLWVQDTWLRARKVSKRSCPQSLPIKTIGRVLKQHVTHSSLKRAAST